MKKLLKKFIIEKMIRGINKNCDICKRLMRKFRLNKKGQFVCYSCWKKDRTIIHIGANGGRPKKI